MATINLPDELYDRAEAQRGDEGFNSVSETIRYLLRRWVEQVGDAE